MAEQKKDKTPLFYPLTNEEWIETVKDLTGAEIKVLYYVRSLDPFGNRELEYGVTYMASMLGLSKGAVSKAIKVLDQMKLIDAELVKVKIRIKPSKSNILEFPEENNVSYRKREFPIGNDDLPEETTVSYKKPQFTRGNKQRSKPGQCKASGSPKDIKKEKELINSLSDLPPEERENFEKFVREEWKRTKGEEIDSFSAVVRGEFFQEWYQKYQNRPELVQATQNAKWENHPHRDEWLRKICTMGNFSFRTEGGKLDKERHEFWNWAVDNDCLQEDNEQ